MGIWKDIKFKVVFFLILNGKIICIVQGIFYLGDYFGVINYDVNGKNMGQIYDDCMDGNDEVCKVIICVLGSQGVG